jgi:hypothetical protein
VCAPAVLCVPVKGREGVGEEMLLQGRYIPFNFAKVLYIVINGGLVELNNRDCAKCW